MALTWDNFDKSFWVSSTNMKNLINEAVWADLAIEGLMFDVSEIKSTVTDMKDYVDKVVELVETNMTNQQAINEGFQAMFKDVAEILLDHEKRLKDIEDVLWPRP